MTEQMPRLSGIHHVSAICGDPQLNLDFYSGLLGLRLVKKTVNFDDPASYHLYYGDGVGSPGSLLTFFAWTAVPPLASAQGRIGAGQITVTSFRVPELSLDFWTDRLAAAAVDFDGPTTRFQETVLELTDPDGLRIELVAGPGRQMQSAWRDSPVPEEHAIRGLHGASLCLAGYERTAALVTGILGFQKIGEQGSRYRFAVGDDGDPGMIDLLVQPQADSGRMGIGVVHHIAWRTSSREPQETWRRVLAEAGFDVTPVLDRHYFESIYFREPGGIIFEIATDGPGFSVDETEQELGSGLKLPPWLEPRRERIEASLPEIRPYRRRPRAERGG